LGFLLFPSGLFAQDAADMRGIQWGGVYIGPEASVLEAYDNRVLPDEVSGDSTSDFYTEVAAGISLYNLPARYALSADARYGYRFYSENTDQNDDFYNTGVAVSTDGTPFRWGLSADVDKSLSYDTFYDPSSGEGPGSILTDQPNRRSVAQGNIAYEKQLTEKTSIMPGYDAMHYFQEFQDSSTAEWQIHNADIELRHEYSTKTSFTVGGGYSLQVNDDEEGYIGTVEVGVEGSMGDKTSWRGSVGVAAADYEVSGSDQSGIFDLRVVWQATEKVSAYIFGGNDYQPGYGGYGSGAARQVYRAGYGADWRFSRRWALGGTVLHDYEQELGSGDGSIYGGVRHFFSAQCRYNITGKLVLFLEGSYAKDEMPTDQAIISARLSYAY